MFKTQQVQSTIWMQIFPPRYFLLCYFGKHLFSTSSQTS